MRREYNSPWIYAGDFNKVLEVEEKFGSLERQEWKMERFGEMMDKCRFSDLGFQGLPYTWDNMQQDDRNINVRLDGALGDDKFSECFDNTLVKHIQCMESYHCALLITVRKSEWIDTKIRGKPFRFYNVWTRHEKYKQVVEEAWQPGVRNLKEMSDHLNNMRVQVQFWSKTEFGSIKKQLSSMRARLEGVWRESVHSGPMKEETDLMKHISELLAREGSLAKQ